MSAIESYKDADTRNRMVDCAMLHNLETSVRQHEALVENEDQQKEWVTVNR